ncbi:twin-arginine translocation signal domain-containing protein [Streptococcus thermophilus]|nr:twin-arginine translocation signal domain-containing protein [Streptococcus thermophilus]MCE2060614.1 twin-arginine translocation signal domain-containing protein [Streptococcus thermophilus]MCE2063403.1 twin-arginine translocation signal domain-containing protein [Streptococcus thermophilus]MCE2065651.1 twin-arginine translocation signal domain-containing protein [Streptococcus thermophilus]MCE2068410.1 twin-arginine translocation signal domain-containing protein [Streptococcus thermophilus
MRVFTPLLPLGRRNFLLFVGITGVVGVTGFSAVPSVTSL